MILWKNSIGFIVLWFSMALSSTSFDIKIIPLLPEHRQSVINLLMSSFFIQEPLNAMLRFDIPHELLTWVDHIVDTSLRDQCSFVAIDTTNVYKTLIGVILNGISNQTHVEEEPPLIIESEKLNFILSLLDQIVNSSDLFKLYETDRLFHCDIINVDESQRRQNISSRLIEVSEERARQLGLKGAFTVCTSLFSRKAFERRQYQVMNEILYSTYGDKQLIDMGEHDRCTLLAKQL